MKCKVCSSRHRKEIDIRLLSRSRTGESLKAIAKGYFGISESSIRRHAEKHLHLKEIESDESHSELTLEDMRKAAVDMYSKATMRSDIKGANDSLGHLIRIEELISKEKDRAFAKNQEDKPIEIELRWADDTTESIPTSIIPTSGLIPELPEAEEIPESIPPEFESPDIEYYKRLAEESKPVQILRNDAGEITAIKTPMGNIPKVKKPEVVDIDFTEYGTRIDSDGVRYDHFPSVGFGVDDFDDLPLLSIATPDIKDRRKRITGGN